MANWQKKEKSKYHYVLGDGIVYLGLPKSEFENEEQSNNESVIASEEVILNLDAPFIKYSDLYLPLFKLDIEERKYIMAAIEKWREKKEEKGKKVKSKFNILYWDIIVDFIFVFYGDTLFDISGRIVEYWKDNETKSCYDQKAIYDRLDKVKNIKLSPSEETVQTINTMLQIYGISDDILKTGKGTWIARIDIRIFKLKLQIVVEDERVDSQLSDFINILIEEMTKKRQE